MRRTKEQDLQQRLQDLQRGNVHRTGNKQRTVLANHCKSLYANNYCTVICNWVSDWVSNWVSQIGLHSDDWRHLGHLGHSGECKNNQEFNLSRKKENDTVRKIATDHELLQVMK